MNAAEVVISLLLSIIFVWTTIELIKTGIRRDDKNKGWGWGAIITPALFAFASLRWFTKAVTRKPPLQGTYGNQNMPAAAHSAYFGSRRRRRRSSRRTRRV